MKLVAISTALVVCTAAPNAQAVERVKNEQKFCRTSEANGWSNTDVKQAIRCAVDHWHVSGGPRKALSVARCESGFNEHDRNPVSSAAGVYQFLSSTWTAVKRHYRKVSRRFSLSDRVLNARANVVLAIRYAHAGGWSPWVCQ